jgi:putative restriction endonuclease
MPLQNYENYWSLTNAYTDYNGVKFLKTLSICIKFIDANKRIAYSSAKYDKLILLILKDIPKTGSDPDLSTRKAVNQLVKMGFINSFLISYNPDSLEYLNAKTNRKRQSLLSKIVYSSSSFNRAVNKNSNLHQLNFLINTLVEVGKLKMEEIIALMLVDISNIKKGFLNSAELNHYVIMANKINFIKRKYNQIGYLTNLLKKLDDIVFVNSELYFTEDAKQIFGENLEVATRQRNPYLHLLYKNQLREESFARYNEEKCMVEKLAYPVLIASHIKPFTKSNDIEAYDVNNGFLLSKNIDSLFDLGYITFDNNGKIIFSKKISKDVIKFISNYTLEQVFLNDKRKAYLSYHRENVFEKRFSVVQ